MKIPLPFSFYWILFFISSVASAQNTTTTVFLVGDAGEDTIPGTALLMLKEQLLLNPESTVLFLGDNVYPNGLRKNDPVSRKHLESQLQLLKDFPGRAYFVPGNHDWDGQKRSGRRILKDEEAYVNQYLEKNSVVSNRNTGSFFPADGLPGPESVMLAPKMRLIFMDTQWFLHFYDKNTVGSKRKTKELFFRRLDSLLAFAKVNNEEVIVAAHHPMYTNGQHARPKQPWRFLVNRTPFQLFGLFGLNRLYSQDISQPRYKKMRKEMLEIFDKYNNITFVSGHDHNLQCFSIGGTKYIVSGAGSKLSPLKSKKRFDAVFQDDKKTGFVKLEFSGGRSTTTIYRSGEKELLLKDY